MPVDIPYSYPDGTTFDNADHNKNIYSNEEFAGVEDGIISEPNGGLVAADLDASFTIARETVQTGEAIQVNSSFTLDANDYYDDVASGITDATFVKIAGRTLRFDLPWTAGCVLWNIQYFFSFDKAFLLYLTDEAEADILIRPTLDGVEINELTRTLEASSYYQDNDGDGEAVAYYVEERLARKHCLSWMSTGLASGYHEFGLTMYMERKSGASLSTTLTRSFGGTTSVNSTFDVRLGNRASFGISNVTALCLYGSPVG